MKLWVGGLLVAISGVLAWVAPPMHAQMPDARQMAGLAIQTEDLPNGVVSVRLIRAELSANIAGHPVEIHGAGDVRTEQTDETGRAQFGGLPAGAFVRAVAEVDGERLESQAFHVPTAGGVRVLLVAGVGVGAAPGEIPGAVEAEPGTVIFGGDSRIIIEFDDDNLEVFYLLEVVNAEDQPVGLSSPWFWTCRRVHREPPFCRGRPRRRTRTERESGSPGRFSRA
jgi:hypothetical protein